MGEAENNYSFLNGNLFMCVNIILKQFLQIQKEKKSQIIRLKGEFKYVSKVWADPQQILSFSGF